MTNQPAPDVDPRDLPPYNINRLRGEIVTDVEFFLSHTTSPVQVINSLLEHWLLTDFDGRQPMHRTWLNLMLELIDLLFSTSQKLKYLEYYEGIERVEGGPDHA